MMMEKELSCGTSAQNALCLFVYLCHFPPFHGSVYCGTAAGFWQTPV